MPSLPTIQPEFESEKLTWFNSVLVPEFWGDQSVPPLIVFRIVPEPPTAQPVLESRKKTELKLFNVSDVCLVQFDPSSEV